MASLPRSGRSGASIEEWLRILQQQEALHAAEVERWRRSIEEAAGFLRKVRELCLVSKGSACFLDIPVYGQNTAMIMIIAVIIMT